MYFDEYIIIDGDTLETISMKSNVSLDELSKYNDLTKLMLVPMQVVKIPNGFKEYTIVATDTWDYILRKTNMTAEEFKKHLYSELSYNKNKYESFENCTWWIYIWSC